MAKNKKIVGFAILVVFFMGLFVYQTAPQKVPEPIVQPQTSDDQPSPPSSSASPAAGQPTTPPTKLPKQQEQSEQIITSAQPTQTADLLSSLGVRVLQEYKNGENSTFVVTLSDAQLETLQSQDDSLTIGKNYRYSPAFAPNDTQSASQWSLDKVSAQSAWDITRGSSDVTLAIIDSGILSSQTINGTTYTQTDIPTSRLFVNAGEQGTTQVGQACWTGSSANKASNDCDDDGNGYVDDWRGWDFMGGFRGNAGCPNFGSSDTYESNEAVGFIYQDNDPQPYSCDSPYSTTVLNKNHYDGSCTTFVSACDVGHGTMVAGVAAAEANNSTLIAGIDHNAKLMNLRIFDGYGYTDTARIAAAITYAKNNGADVINLSLAFETCNGSFVDSTLEAAMASAKAAGVTIVAASGNNNASNVCYPASSTHAIGVGASTSSDTRASFSSYGSQLDVIAPGQSVPTTNAPSGYLDTNYASGANGTSFAAPHVAGLATLIKAVKPAATPNEIRDIIRYRGDIVTAMSNSSFHSQYGYGRMNMYASLRVAQDEKPIYKVLLPDGSDHLYTDNVLERNAYLPSKATYQGIYSWNTGSNYLGNLSELRTE